MNEPPPEPTPFPPVSGRERFAAGMLALLVAATVTMWWGEPLFEPSAFAVFFGELKSAWRDTIAILVRWGDVGGGWLDSLLFTVYASSLLGLILGWLFLFPLALAGAAGRLPGWAGTLMWWLTLTHGAMALYCFGASFSPVGRPDPAQRGWIALGFWLVGKVTQPSQLAFVLPALELPLAAAVLWFTRTRRRSESTGGVETRA